MKRRAFLNCLAAGAAQPFLGHALGANRSLRIAFVSPVPRKSNPVFDAFVKRLADFGWREGENFVFDYGVFASGATEEQRRALLGPMARKADILLTGGPEYQLKDALAVSSTLPILMMAIDYDPVERGYVAALNQRDRRITGMFLRQIELAVKRLHFLKDNFPDMRSALVFYDEISRDQWEAVERVGPGMGLKLHGFAFKDGLDYEAALAAVPAEDRKFLYVLASPRFFYNRKPQIEFAERNRLISMFVFREWTDDGGLMSYGPSGPGMWRRAAELADQLARGAKPGDLPIEQPTKFEFIVNLKTAKALGLDLPPNLLAGADEIIE